jgi:hypothetical protein
MLRLWTFEIVTNLRVWVKSVEIRPTYHALIHTSIAETLISSILCHLSTSSLGWLVRVLGTTSIYRHAILHVLLPIGYCFVELTVLSFIVNKYLTDLLLSVALNIGSYFRMVTVVYSRLHWGSVPILVTVGIGRYHLLDVVRRFQVILLKFLVIVIVWSSIVRSFCCGCWLVLWVFVKICSCVIKLGTLNLLIANGYCLNP